MSVHVKVLGKEYGLVAPYQGAIPDGLVPDETLITRAYACNEMGVNNYTRMIIPKVSHRTQVEVVDRHCYGQGVEDWKTGPDADAVVTACRDTVIGIHVGDCLPVFAFCEKTGVIGVAHVSAQNVSPLYIGEFIQSLYDIGGRDISVVFGPHLQMASYEIRDDERGQEIRNRFPDFVEETLFGLRFNLTGLVATMITPRIAGPIDMSLCEDTWTADKWYSWRAGDQASANLACITAH